MSRPDHSISLFLALVIMCGCVESYYPDEISSAARVLVVEGHINTTDNTATVLLSYSTDLNSTDLQAPEEAAAVKIEREDATQYTLSETTAGTYQLEGMNFDLAAKYRLLVTTKEGKSFTSDLIELTATPPIDSITWKAEENGIRLYGNTHDPEKASKYYMWKYEETWEHTASLVSRYKLIDGVVFPREQEDMLYQCWTSQKSTQILVGNTERLSSEVISDFPLTFITGGTIRISRRYSIIVQQQSLTKEAYEFWSQLQTLSEGLGGLFDSQPYQLAGNIHSNDNNETVLGYFSGGATTEQRIFINYQDLPGYLAGMREPAICDEDDIQSIDLEDLPSAPNSLLLIDPISSPAGSPIIGYTWAETYCLDCRTQGGGLVKPDFW